MDPFSHPRTNSDVIFVAELRVSAYFADLRTASSALRKALLPDHMNYELLGNTNPHLHWHLIPRYRSDPRWGRPIREDYPRNEFTINRYVLADAEYLALIRRIQVYLLGKEI